MSALSFPKLPGDVKDYSCRRLDLTKVATKIQTIFTREINRNQL